MKIPMHVIKVALSILTPLLIANIASASKTPVLVEKLAKMYTTTLKTCPKKMHANSGWSQFPILFFHPGAKESWLFTVADNSLVAILNSKLSNLSKTSSFSKATIQGAETLILAVENRTDPAYISYIFKLGIHEGFHYFGQKGWKFGAVDEMLLMGSYYPSLWKPRFLRFSLYTNLLLALKAHPKQQGTYLSQASYWYSQWKSEFPDEIKSSSDLLEGSAEYMQTIAQAVIVSGCAATTEQLKKASIKFANSDLGGSVAGNYFDFHREGYDLGAMALLVLRFSSQKNWQDRLIAGENPLEILLSKKSQIRQTAPATAKKPFAALAKEENNYYELEIGQDILNWPLKSFVRLHTPPEWLQSSLTLKFFIISRTLGHTMAKAAQLHKFANTNGDFINIDYENSFFFPLKNPCGLDEDSLFTLIERKNIKLSNSRYEVDGNTVAAFSGRMITHNGLDYLCPQ